MATRSRTLANLLADVQYAADIQASSTRHTDASLYRLLNESIQKLRVMVSNQGHPLYLKPSSGTLTAGLTSPYAFASASLPDDLVSLYAFDVTVASNDVREVDIVPFSERNSYQSRFGGSLGIPVACYVYNIGTESTTTVTVGKVAVFPAPQQAYAYTFWYLPSWVDISSANAATYVFNGLAGWEDWVVQDVVCKAVQRDNDARGTYAIAQAERQKAEERIIADCNRIHRIGPSTRVDASRRSRVNGRGEVLRRP